MMRVYGKQKTKLVLTGKAKDVYSGIDPLTIIEHEDDDGNCTYTIKEPGWNVGMMAEDELIAWLENMEE